MFYKTLIDKYKSFRKRSYLNKPGKYRSQYAFAGVGHHSITNLYPCLESLHVHLRFIHSRHLGNAQKLSSRFPGCVATDNMNDIFHDAEIKGVFICSHPSTHFTLLQDALSAKKHVFIEKPPCYDLQELKKLIALQQDTICMVGLQKRFGTINKLIKRHKLANKANSYVYRYCTGSYPEGDALVELFIHPIDNIIRLFGKPDVLDIRKITDQGNITFHILTSHSNGVRGMVELSTQYSWQEAIETLEINGAHRTVQANYPHQLKTLEKPGTLLNIPLEKILPGPSIHKIYFNNTGFAPVDTNNSLVINGFYPEIQYFIHAVETGKRNPWTDLHAMLPVYEIIEQLRSY